MMNIINDLKLSVIGLGYVGLSIAAAFAKKIPVIGFDINKHKIEAYKNGNDLTNEVGNDCLQSLPIKFTTNPSALREANFHIVSVPTPISIDKTPDLSFLIHACNILGANLKKGCTVVFESTVYPGTTEEICIPILEKSSNMTCGIDFEVGYSPERINPGDKKNRFENINKIISARNMTVCEKIAEVYSLVVTSELIKTPSIKVAEAAKVIENTQRDVNIAFMNEIAIALKYMHISPKDVFQVMSTKWNALNFHPGLVGGHCISVDPYYFYYKAEQMGFKSELIPLSRKINDSFGLYIVEEAVKRIACEGFVFSKVRVAIFGVTYKANCPDMRNSQAVHIIQQLKQYKIDPFVVDPYADKDYINNNLHLNLIDMHCLSNIDCAIFLLDHDCFRSITLEELDEFFRKNEKRRKIVLDTPSLFSSKIGINSGYSYWHI